MRVVSGKYKGKILQGFNIDGTRPTMDRIKESMFAMIQNDMKNSVCLDLFAGSGSLGIEALSNNAKKCYFVEKSNKVLPYLKENIKDMEDAYLLTGDYKNQLNEIDEKVDIVFLDPPYQLNLINEAISLIIDKKILKENALIVCELEKENVENNLKVLKSKKYGDKYINIYRYK